MAQLDEWLATAQAAVDAAVAVLHDARPTEIRGKGNPRDLVTEWDLRAEDAIRQVLRARTPGITIVGEEGGAEAGGGGARWLVDPIDGTVNFAHGLPLWAVSIGLVDDAGPAVGVVAAPRLGWRYLAARGAGAWLVEHGERRRLAVSAVERLDQALLVTGFPYDRATSPDNNFAEWAHLQRRAGACRRLGAASLDLCLVASGALDGYWERKLKPWDVAAGVVVVAEAGGVVTTTTGDRFDVDGGEVVATNGIVHAALVAELAAVRAARGTHEPI
ncbi:MAG: inositol monophosphatase family protein [Kofleriaceae bacterium]